MASIYPRRDVPKRFAGGGFGYVGAVDQYVAVTEGLTKAFAPDAGVFDLDVEVPAGRIVGFVGPSGSGKTTTVRLMIGLIQPDSGSIEVLGMTPTAFDPATRGRVGYMPQSSILYPDLTLAQNLEFSASLYGMGRKSRSRLDDLVDFLDLEGAMTRVPAQASGGEQRRLMLAASLVHEPELLFLDEPTAGIDPVLRRKVWDRLAEISDQGTSLIVTTQYVGEAAYCDYVAVLVEGKILFFDTPEGLRRAAFGGELVDIVFSERPSFANLESLQTAASAESVERVDDQRIRMVVEDAGTAGPVINEWSQTNRVEILETEAHVPPFDDVFVQLVDRQTSERQAAAGSADRPARG